MKKVFHEKFQSFVKLLYLHRKLFGDNTLLQNYKLDKNHLYSDNLKNLENEYMNTKQFKKNCVQVNFQKSSIHLKIQGPQFTDSKEKSIKNCFVFFGIRWTFPRKFPASKIVKLIEI
jgi:hypothetical protein